ncbi:MAG TPA: helix-turn-helix transcriptional regulator [Polyangiaceae bacterium]|jgi:transcriptional regulator with XRE-family HTH domain
MGKRGDGSSLAERLRELRITAGISSRELGRLAGLSHGHIGQIEREELDVRAVKLVGIAEVLGVSLDWLCLGKGEPPSGEMLQRSIRAARRRHEAARVA